MLDGLFAKTYLGSRVDDIVISGRYGRGVGKVFGGSLETADWIGEEMRHAPDRVQELTDMRRLNTPGERQKLPASGQTDGHGVAWVGDEELGAVARTIGDMPTKHAQDQAGSSPPREYNTGAEWTGGHARALEAFEELHRGSYKHPKSLVKKVLHGQAA